MPSLKTTKKIIIYIFIIFLSLQLFFILLNSSDSIQLDQELRILSRWKLERIPASPLTQYAKTAGIQRRGSVYDLEVVRNASLIFIGGYARSGTTLMRALLDVHDDIMCGPETKIIPEILKFAFEYKILPKNMRDIEDAGLSEEKLDDALRLYIYSIMNEHIKPAARLCDKDPNILIHMLYLKQLFPNAKFIFMVRDARAAVYSLLKQYNETLNAFNARKYLITWNQYNQKVNHECGMLGAESCLLVRYESLVLNANATLHNVTRFLNVTWTDDFLVHNRFVGSKIAVSATEWSTPQIKRPIHRDSLNMWVSDMRYEPAELYSRANMMLYFGYNIELKHYDYLRT